MITDDDIFIKLINFPNYSANGVTVPNDDGTYTIYINALVDEARRKEALDHELHHIIRGDFDEHIRGSAYDAS